jgi:D-alanyl-D-alanine carboxypeptidase/D-alanyl-D-alanine-endopeptidase (penicillin-binding protein 4)
MVWTPGQTILRDLQIVGGGDPNLSGRILPYDVKAKPGDALTALRQLAGKLADAGIKEITGDVTGVATRYSGDPYPDGWTIDDSIYDYGAPISALTFNDNAVTVKLTPGEIGDIAELATTPVNTPLLFLNEVTTSPGGETQVHVGRAPGSNEVVLTGNIGAAAIPWQQDLAVLDPARWTAATLIDALRDCGITVRGEPRSQYEGPPTAGTVVAVHESAPLAQTLTVVNKVSQNLHAEMFLREVGFVSQGSGTLRAGVEERTKFLQELGITQDLTGLALQDGSGLARQDLTTPDSTVALLRAMWQRPERDVWLASLPIGGVDGSLEHRFKNIPGAERIHAKTGSLSHVNALSGYIETRQHGWVAFSVMINATEGHSADVHTFIDRLCALFLSI